MLRTEPIRSVYGKLVAAFAAVAVFVAAFVGVAIVIHFETVDHAATIEAHHVAELIADGAIENGAIRPDLQSYVQRLNAVRERDVVIVDVHKRGLADANPSEVGLTYQFDGNNEVGLTIADGKMRSFVERNVLHPEGAHQIVVPLKLRDSKGTRITVGAIILEYTSIRNALLSVERRDLAIIAGAGVFAVVLVLILGIGTARRVSRPLLDLKSSVDRVAAQDYEARVHVTSTDEIGALGTAFNRMAEDLSIVHGRLKYHKSQLELRVDELEAARSAAHAASLAKSEFLANMSHEIRTPMNAVLGMVYLLRDTPLSSTQKMYLEMIRVSGQSLLDILNDILDFSKVEAGRMELVPAPFKLGDLLGSLASIMSVNAGEKDLELAIGVDPDVPLNLVGDAMRLQQILVNLTGNAIKFTESGEVSVLVRLLERRDDQVRLQFEVRDTGIGMNEDQQSRLFVAFSQGDSSMTRRFGGTGLGLTISKRLLDLMGGSIVVQSQLGEGSNFCVTLPFRVAPEQELRLREKALRDLHVLVVDDNATCRDFLARTIRTWNWKVDSVESGAQALTQVASGRQYDLILLDWKMPGMDGVATMRAIRAQAPQAGHAFLLMVSAFGCSTLMADQAALQIDGVLIKPVTSSSLFDMVHELFTSRDAARVQSEVAVPAPGTPRFDGARLLLVEDNALNQIIASGILQKLGAHVEIAENGQDAIDLLSKNSNFDLVLMDVQMPVMDGYAATRHIRERLGLNLPILAITAGVMESERELCVASGMNDVIAKPFDIERMQATIARHLAGLRASV